MTFRLKRQQPAFIALLASGFSPVYPCHVPPREMRQRPIGTGPFKFVEFKPNEVIRVTRNPDYWKPGRPYLDGIEYTIIKSQSTGLLAFVAGNFDMTSPYFLQVPLLKRHQEPAAAGDLRAVPIERPAQRHDQSRRSPFDNPELRRAMRSDPRPQGVHRHLDPGQGRHRRRVAGCRPRASGACRPSCMQKLPGYDPDVAKNRAEARKIMEKLGYGPDKRLSLKVSTRDIAPYRDPAVILLTS